MKTFNEKFDSYVCDGDSIETEINGIRYVARIMHDPDSNIDDDDTHNSDQTITGCNDAQQEKLLKARNAWLNDEWFYCGVVVIAYLREIELDSASLWGIEANYPGGDNNYLTELSNELLQELNLFPALNALVSDASKAMKYL